MKKIVLISIILVTLLALNVYAGAKGVPFQELQDAINNNTELLTSFVEYDEFVNATTYLEKYIDNETAELDVEMDALWRDNIEMGKELEREEGSRIIGDDDLQSQVDEITDNYDILAWHIEQFDFPTLESKVDNNSFVIDSFFDVFTELEIKQAVEEAARIAADDGLRDDYIALRTEVDEEIIINDVQDAEMIQIRNDTDNLRFQIDSETAARMAAIGALLDEVILRDFELEGRVDGRINAAFDVVFNGQIELEDAFEYEKNRVQTELAKEATARIGNDTVLKSELDNEVGARVAAIEGLLDEIILRDFLLEGTLRGEINDAYEINFNSNLELRNDFEYNKGQVAARLDSAELAIEVEESERVAADVGLQSQIEALWGVILEIPDYFGVPSFFDVFVELDTTNDEQDDRIAALEAENANLIARINILEGFHVDVCDPNPCTLPNRNVCVDNNGIAVCECNPGYEEDGTGNCVLGCSAEPETCDDIDNDCDGLVDEDFVNLGETCDGPDSDECMNGFYTCTWDGSGVECVNENPENIPEVCDGQDNDCDGTIDPECGGICYYDISIEYYRKDNCLYETAEDCYSETNCYYIEGEDCDDDNLCTDDLWDSQYEYCSNVPNPGNVCDDNNACTMSDVCSVDGSCVGTSFTCDDANECTTDSCDGTGGCDFVSNTAASCDDGDACTINDMCMTDGSCVGEFDEGCQECVPDETRTCTVENVYGTCEGTEVCDASMGWIGCTAQTPSQEICDYLDNDCDGPADEDFPNLGEACDGPDSDQCMNGVYTCMWEGSGVECVNENPENIPEVCDGQDNDCDGGVDEDFDLMTDELNCGSCAVVCAPGDECVDASCQAINCDDGNLCTTDSYSVESMGCENVPNPASLCDDGNECTFDSCNPSLGCTHGNLYGSMCDDGDVCTINDRCSDSLPMVCTGGDSFCPSGEVCSDVGGIPVCECSPVTEVCDGQDNDCDGDIDEGNPGGGGSCNTGLSGSCSFGAWQCQSGSLNCVQTVFPSSEICDGLDNDCDGVNDENPDSLCANSDCYIMTCSTTGWCSVKQHLCIGECSESYSCGWLGGDTCYNYWDNYCDGDQCSC